MTRRRAGEAHSVQLPADTGHPSSTTAMGLTSDPPEDLPPLTAEDLREPPIDLTTPACGEVPGCDAASVTVRLVGGALPRSAGVTEVP